VNNPAPLRPPASPQDVRLHWSPAKQYRFRRPLE
jgi:hypothetical protein